MKTVDINLARELLIKGDVVAIPTETVYGLAAWIYSEAGLRKIFSTKERPFFDPLIVHIDSIEKAKSLTGNWTVVHEILAKSCWPGPLTLIAKKNLRSSCSLLLMVVSQHQVLTNLEKLLPVKQVTFFMSSVMTFLFWMEVLVRLGLNRLSLELKNIVMDGKFSYTDQDILRRKH